MTWVCLCGVKVRNDKCKFCGLTLDEYLRDSQYIIRPAEEEENKW
jgi:hypothetical protein